jgi:hypothetical protein
MAATALIFSLAESLFKTNEDLFPTTSLSSSRFHHSASLPSDEILHTLLDKFLLTLSPTLDSALGSDGDGTDKNSFKQIQSEIFSSKEKYFHLLKFFLQKIDRQSAQQNQLSNLPWKALLNKKSNFLQLFHHKLSEKSIDNVLFLLRNCQLGHPKDLCSALLSISLHSPSQELNETILHLISHRLRHDSSSSSLVSIACLQAYLLVSQTQLAPTASSPLMLLHSQKSSFFTALAFVAIWSTSFPLSAEDQRRVLTQTRPLFQSTARELGSSATERDFESTDPAAIYLIRKWLHSHLASPQSRATAQELLRLLGEIEHSVFKKNCPELLLQSLSLPETPALLRWDGLLARDDIEGNCRQKITKLIAPKASRPQRASAEDDHEPQQLEEEEVAELTTAAAADDESEWRSLLRGKKTLRANAAKEKIAPAPAVTGADSGDEEEKVEDGEGEIDFVLDTKGDQAALEQEQVEQEATPPPEPVPEKKSRGKRKESVQELPTSEVQGATVEADEGGGAGDEGRSTRRSKRTRK